jgi:hypothetical protein
MVEFSNGKTADIEYIIEMRKKQKKYILTNKNGANGY